MAKNSHIKFICEDYDSFQLYPPVPATKMVPLWYKDLSIFIKNAPGKENQENVPSVKKCMPVLDYITSGYILRNSYQIRVSPYDDNQGIRHFKLDCNRKDYVGAHPWHQAPIEIDGSKTHYFKINQQWVVRTPPGYSSLIYQPYYNFRKEFSFLPAVVDTDVHPACIGLVGIIKSQEEFFINPGDPLVVVFPFKREEWISTIEHDPDLIKKSNFKLYLQGLWHGFYQKFLHNKKSYS